METVNLGIGEPEPSILPLAELGKAAEHCCSLADKSCLQYGPEEGNPAFRRRLATFLSRHVGVDICPDNLLITGGASHGLDLILSRLTREGDTIFVEAPTYFFALDVFNGRRVRLVPVKTDEHGIDIDDLESQLETHKPKFLYTIPVFHNPTGTTLPEPRRRRLVELAKAHGFLIVADEVYQLTGEESETPPPLRSLDGECVLSLGSFSKILGPGLRLGWIECAKQHVDELSQCGVLISGGGVNPFMAAIVDSAIELGIQDRYLSTVCTMYNRRRLYMTRLLEEMLPDGVHFTKPHGGYYIWLELPKDMDSVELRKEALTRNIDFRPGPIFSCEGRFSNCLRLCFTYYPEDKLQFACEQLSRLLHSYT